MGADQYRDRFLTGIEAVQTPQWELVDDFESALYRLSQEPETTPRDELLQTFVTAVSIRAAECLKQHPDVSSQVIAAALENCAEQSLDLDELKRMASTLAADPNEDEPGLFDKIDQTADSPITKLQYELLLFAGAAQLNGKISPEDTHDHILLAAASLAEFDAMR
jgi:hypothetical protein